MTRRASFKPHLGLQTRDVTIDRRHGERASAAFLAHEAIPGGDVSLDGEFVKSLGMADVVDGDVVVLAPEERRRGEFFALADHVERGDLPRSATTQCSTRMASPLRGITVTLAYFAKCLDEGPQLDLIREKGNDTPADRGSFRKRLETKVFLAARLGQKRVILLCLHVNLE